MVQKYQNEISPIFYYGISRKTYEKDLKIATLQLPDWKSLYWMTLYIIFICVNVDEWLENAVLPERPLTRYDYDYMYYSNIRGCTQKDERWKKMSKMAWNAF